MRKRSSKNRSQVDVFKEIANERPHKCQVCGSPIESLGPINFSHLLPKGAYIKYKYDKRNIIIKCADCHTKWGNERAKNLIHIDIWKWVCELYYELMREANGCSNTDTTDNQE